MNQAILGIVLAISFGMTLSFPLTCDKLKDVKEGANNNDQYLVKLKDPDNYQDAEYVINLVNQYQAILEQHASNVHESSIRNQLELSETAGVLHGTLSEQALILVCLESKVEFILPDYPKIMIDPQGSGDVEDVYIAECSKLILNEPYHGNNYSVVFKRKTSLNTLYHVITKMELAKLSDDTVTFNFYSSIKKGTQIIMVVGMNNKALKMACKEPKIKQIRPNHDVSVISVNKRNTESTSNTEVLVPSPLTGHCDLPEYDEEFSTIIFIYNETASLTETAESVKGYRNPARVMLATVIEGVHMIIFQMNREAYLQACKDPKFLLVEHVQIHQKQTHQPLK